MEVLDNSDYYSKRGKLRKKSGITGLYQSLFQSRFARRFAHRTKKAIHYAMEGMGKEAKETQDMARHFYRILGNKLDLNNRTTPPTQEEVKEAIEQLKDIGRISIFASISILPGGGFSLIGLELLARKFGIKGFTFVPSAFRKEDTSRGKGQKGREDIQPGPDESTLN